MIRTVIIVREAETTKPEYSLEFDLPALPRAGDYLSIQRPDTPEPYGEDMIVRQIWWRLNHSTTGGQEVDPRAVGDMKEVYIECEPAVSPWSSDAWKRSLSAGIEGGQIEKFKVERMAIVSESALRDRK